MPNSTAGTKEVTFITSTGDMMIRMVRNDTRDICAAAIVLKATHFVTADDFDAANNCPIWGVFEMRTAEKDNPCPGAWSIRDPIFTHSSETSDAAVMWAMHRGAR